MVSENSVQANLVKFQGILLKGNKYVSDSKFSTKGKDVNFSKSITFFEVYGGIEGQPQIL